MQVSTRLCIYQMQPIKVHELAPPTYVLLLSKNFDPSLFSNVAPSLSMSMSYLFPLYILKIFISFTSLYNLSPYLSYHIISYLCTISPPLSSISIKGMLLIDAKVCTLGQMVETRSLHFLWTLLEYWNDTTCRYHLKKCDLYYLYLIILMHGSSILYT